jgi:hypothetical protein
VNASNPCLSVDGWRKGQSEWTADDMLHESCFVGIDLASKIDLMLAVVRVSADVRAGPRGGCCSTSGRRKRR